jgi:hypothetical protein
MQTLLAGLEREQLQALLLSLVEQQPDLADVIEAQVHRVHSTPRAGSRRHGLPIVLPVARRSGRPIWQS